MLANGVVLNEAKSRYELTVDGVLAVCEYRRTVRQVLLQPGERCVLFVGAAMHTATVLVDGRSVARHEGGYLPFTADLTDA